MKTFYYPNSIPQIRVVQCNLNTTLAKHLLTKFDEKAQKNGSIEHVCYANRLCASSNQLRRQANRSYESPNQQHIRSNRSYASPNQQHRRSNRSYASPNQQHRRSNRLYEHPNITLIFYQPFIKYKKTPFSDVSYIYPLLF